MCHNHRKSFIRKELWLLTYSAGFQRAHIYNKDKVVSEAERKAFKINLFKFCNDLVENQYKNRVTDDIHIKNIRSVINFTEANYNDILNNGRLKFGVAQKILNLYLKYLWCNNEITTPPHFPVDRIIQEKLKLPEKYRWTKMDSEDEYLTIINQSKSIMKLKGYRNLAEMELNEYNRN